MGTDKGLVRLDGTPLIEHALGIMGKLTPQILISSNSDSLRNYGYPVIKDQFPNSGPMGGIYSCLMNTGTEINLVLSCDTPFIYPEFYKKLLEHIGNFDIVAPWYYSDRYEPLCAVYKRKNKRFDEEFLF